MGAKLKPGVAQVNVELPDVLLDEVKAFAEARGQHLREVFQRAIRRHMDNPPPLVPDPPLPPCPPDPPSTKVLKPKRPRKK